MAIDRDAIARTVYNGTKDPATGILPAGMRGFAPGACASCEFSRDRAARLLQSALGGDVPTIGIDHLNDATSKKVAAAIASDLNAAGVHAVLKPHTRREYLALLQAGKQDFAQLGWISDTPTPDGFLAEQLGGSSANNQTGYSDPAFDAAIVRARAARHEAERLGAYRAAEARALSAMPLVPIVFFRNRTAIASRVHDVVLNGAGVFDGAAVSIS
jgi:oligopeptide transport system substrate-binding protein